MGFCMKRRMLTACAVLLVLSPPLHAGDREDLTALLHEFLAAADKAEMHERFWADDLVYSSSAGLRFGKADIMAGFASASEEAAEPAVVYSGEDVDVRLYGDTAVVAFRLVGTPADASGDEAVQRYFNTGMFVRHDGTWQAVAWQATKIPAEE